jgi:hypothetical protein
LLSDGAFGVLRRLPATLPPFLALLLLMLPALPLALAQISGSALV